MDESTPGTREQEPRFLWDHKGRSRRALHTIGGGEEAVSSPQGEKNWLVRAVKDILYILCST